MADLNHNKPTVLVVDDEPNVRSVVKELLSAAGYRCVTSQDGESAYELAVRTGALVAVIDLKLPGIDGGELAGRLKRECPGMGMIAISGHLDSWDLDELKSLGVDEALAKPFRAAQLIEAVERAIGRAPSP